MKIKSSIFFCVILSFSMVLIVIWQSLGTSWYIKVIPFFDSLSYQNKSVAIVQAQKDSGYINGVKYAYRSFTYAPLHQLYIAAISPFLPRNRFILYIYLLPTHMIAVAAVALLIYKKTRSANLAFLGWGIYLTTTPFRELMGGVLDQRLDLVTGSLALFFWVAYIWWEGNMSFKISAILGGTLGIAILYRPVFIVQGLLFIALRFLCVWAKKDSAQAKSYTKGLAIVLIVAFLICAPVIIPNAQRYYDYYTLVNINTFSASTFIEGLSYNLQIYVTSIGNVTLVIAGVLLLTAIVIRRNIQWNEYAIVFLAILSSLAPLIISRSTGNPYVIYTALAAIALFPLSMSSLEQQQASRFILSCVTGFMFLVIGYNLYTLATSVESLSSQSRKNAEDTLQKIAVYSQNTPIYLSGFTPITSGMISLAQIELGCSIKSGETPYQAWDFGLTKQQATDPYYQSIAIEGVLNKMYETGGFVMLVDPANYPNPFNTYSDSIMEQITENALASGRLINIGITLRYENTTYRFYQISKE